MIERPMPYFGEIEVRTIKRGSFFIPSRPTYHDVIFSRRGSPGDNFSKMMHEWLHEGKEKEITFLRYTNAQAKINAYGNYAKNPIKCWKFSGFLIKYIESTGPGGWDFKCTFLVNTFREEKINVSS